MWGDIAAESQAHNAQPWVQSNVQLNRYTCSRTCVCVYKKQNTCAEEELSNRGGLKITTILYMIYTINHF